jgi:hypothetical protein
MAHQSPSKGNRLSSVAPALILLLAAALRLFRIGNQSLWADEGNSVALAARSLREISAAAAADIHPPLYYWLLSLWTRIFGTSEIAVRSLSAVWGVVLVWLVYQIGSRLFDKRTGTVAALLAAVNPFLIYYSQEARMYAQLAALAALLFYALIRFILHESIILPADGSGKSIAFSGPATAILVGASIAGLYTHYTYPVMIGVATLLYLLWVYNSRRRGFVRERLLHWAMLLIIVAFAYLPWWRTAYQQLTNWPRSGQAVALNDAVSEILRLLALGPVAQVEVNSPWMAVFLLLFILGFWPWARPDRARGYWLSWLLPLLWLAAPVGMVLLGGLYKPAFMKFLVVAAAPFCLLMARGATGFMEALERESWHRPSRSRGRGKSNRKRPATAKDSGNPQESTNLGHWLGRAWLVMVLVLLLIPTTKTLQAYYLDPSVARDDYRGMAAYIQAVADPQDGIILNAPGQQDVFDYYYQGDLPVYGLPAERPPDTPATIATLEQLARQHPQLYLLLWATDESDPEHLVEEWLDTHAYKAKDTWRGNVRFVIYATQQSTESWPVETVDTTLGDQIRLVSQALAGKTITAGDVLQLQLVWEALETPAVDYTVFVQLLDQRNQVVVQRDAPPVSGGRPTTGWQPGDRIVDNHGLLVVPGTAPGDYRLIVGMYNVETGERLPTPVTDYIDLGDIRIERPQDSPTVEALNIQHLDPFVFEEVTLLGHDRYRRGFRHQPDTPLRPNDLLHLTFYWQANVKPTTAWWFTARLVQGVDQEVAAVSGPLVSQQYPTLNWQSGEVVRGEHDVLLPDYLEPGRYQLQLFLHTGSNPEAVADRVNLGGVEISDESS